jgi:hypothetical protein
MSSFLSTWLRKDGCLWALWGLGGGHGLCGDLEAAVASVGTWRRPWPLWGLGGGRGLCGDLEAAVASVGTWRRPWPLEGMPSHSPLSPSPRHEGTMPSACGFCSPPPLHTLGLSTVNTMPLGAAKSGEVLASRKGRVSSTQEGVRTAKARNPCLVGHVICSCSDLARIVLRCTRQVLDPRLGQLIRSQVPEHQPSPSA